MLVVYLLWYNKLHGDLEEIGIEFSPYDRCVSKRMVDNN